MAAEFSPAELKQFIFDNPSLHLIIFQEDIEEEYGYPDGIVMRYAKTGVSITRCIRYLEDGEYSTPYRDFAFETIKDIIIHYLFEMGLVDRPGTIIMINTLKGNPNYQDEQWKDIPNGIYTISYKK